MPYYRQKEGSVTDPEFSIPGPGDHWEVGYEYQDVMTLTLLQSSLKIMPSDLFFFFFPWGNKVSLNLSKLESPKEC